MRLSFFLALIGLFAFIAYGQSNNIQFDFKPPSVGVVSRSSDRYRAGTGFIVKNKDGKQTLLTCAHVSAAQVDSYQPAGSEKVYRINLTLAIPAQDISFYTLNEEVPNAGFSLGEGKRLAVGDNIVYIGFKVQSQNLEVDRATISAIGTGTTFGGVADFLEFVGEGKPGFSGGPIMNTKGEVVAIMTEAWAKQGYQPNAPVQNVNRGVLTEFARVLFGETLAFHPAKQ